MHCKGEKRRKKQDIAKLLPRWIASMYVFVLECFKSFQNYILNVRQLVFGRSWTTFELSMH